MFWFFVLYFAVGYVLKPGEIAHKKGMTIIIIILPKVQVAGCSWTCKHPTYMALHEVMWHGCMVYTQCAEEAAVPLAPAM